MNSLAINTKRNEYRLEWPESCLSGKTLAKVYVWVQTAREYAHLRYMNIDADAPDEQAIAKNLISREEGVLL